MTRKKKNKTTDSKTVDISHGTNGLKLERGVKNWHLILSLGLLCMAFYYKVIFGIGDFWEDLIYQEFPHRVFARDCFLQFSFPHWNPYTFSGMPFFSAIHTGVLYPFNVLLSFIPAPLNVFWYLLEIMIIAHVFIAGWSMFVYVMSKGMSRSASFFAAISYMFCGFFITHIMHSLMVYILAWLPLIVLFIEKGIQRRQWSHHCIAGTLLGLTIFAGHPQITFYEFLFLGIYSLFLWFSSGSRKRIISFCYICLTFVLAIGIGMVQLLPAFELSTHSARIDWTFEKASEGSFSFAQWITFILPKVFGSWSSPESQAPQFWLKGPLNGYYTYWDTCFYSGCAIFVFALFQCRQWKKNAFVRFAIVWCIVSMSVALGRNFFVYKILFDYIPGFGQFRVPARILFTWNFLLPVCAAYAFDRLADTKPRTLKKVFLPIIGFCLSIGIFTGLGILKIWWPLEMSNLKLSSYASIQGFIGAGNAFMLFIVILLLHQKKIAIVRTKHILIVLLLVDMFVFGLHHHISKKGGAHDFFSQAKDISQAIIQNSKSENFRVSMRQFKLEESTPIGQQTGLIVIKRNQGMIDKIQLFEGYNPLQLYRRIPPGLGKHFARHLDILNIKYYINPGYGKDSKQLLLLNEDLLPRAKMFYSYTVFDNDSLIKEYMINHDFDYRTRLLLTEKPTFSSQDTRSPINNNVDILDYERNKISLRVSTEKPGMLWLSEMWYPAWKAYANGKKVKIHCADYSFRAIEIPVGENRIEFVYQSSYFRLGAMVSLFTLLLIVSTLLFPYVKNKSFPFSFWQLKK